MSKLLILTYQHNAKQNIQEPSKDIFET